MALEIKLKIGKEEKTFVRNGDPNLRDLTNALKVQYQQIRMYSKDDGPSNQDIEENLVNTSAFAIDFWNKQFSTDEFILGATENLQSMRAVEKALDATLNPEGVKGDPKKSRKATPKKPSTISTTSIKENSKKATN